MGRVPFSDRKPEARVERMRYDNPIVIMTGFVAPAATQGVGGLLVDTSLRRLH